MLCDDIYSSAGSLRQLTCPDMGLPKVPELAEADWYRMMASAITRVSIFFLYYFFVVDLLYLVKF